MKSVKNFKKICLVAIATICATLFLSCESTNVSSNEKELLSTFSKEWIENIFSKKLLPTISSNNPNARLII